jgi:cell division protein FtsB
MSDFKYFFQKYINNFYFWSTLVFLIWIMFLDGNDLINRFQMQSKLAELEAERAFYLQQIEQIKAQERALEIRADNLEKFAREQYLMKREGEEIFIIEKAQ